MSILKRLSRRLTGKTKIAKSTLMPAYARLQTSFVRGDGCTLWDQSGQEYLDALGGIAVCFLGHSHPTISHVIRQQSESLMHVSNLFEIPQQTELGQRFCDISGMDNVFFCNSGTEANEAAIKLSRLYAKEQGVAKPIVLTAEGSFHGRSIGALSATGNEAIKEDFTPLLAGFEHVPYNDITAMQAYADDPNVVAIMIEPIQGEAGIIVPDKGYLRALRKLCDKQNWLLIIDEIQSGMGRTGKWFAFQHEAIRADIVTSAKALGNGYPIGACAARGHAAKLLNPGGHGTTFGGNPLASAVGLAVINTIEENNFVSKAASLGSKLKLELEQTLLGLDNVTAVRGKGLMLAIQLDHIYDGLAQRFLDAGLVVNITGGGKIIRLLPSVLISDEQITKVASICHDIIQALDTNEQ